MELFLGIVIEVLISFLVFYLTKKMSLNEQEMNLKREQRREALAACNKQLQEQMSEQLQLLQHINVTGFEKTRLPHTSNFLTLANHNFL